MHLRWPLRILIACGVLAGCVALRIVDPEPVARLRLSVFDSYLRMSPRTPDPEFPVRVVAIDETSLANIGQWPWPRTKLAELVSRLSEWGAKSVTFDLVLAEPDRLSPQELAHALGTERIPTDMVAQIARLPSNDAQLAQALSKAPSIVSIVGDRSGARTLEAYRGGISFAGDNPAEFVPAFPAGISSLPELVAAAKGVGAVNWLPSQDQIVRRIPLLISIAGKIYPSVSLEAMRIGTGQSTIFVKSSGGSGVASFGQRTGVESIRVGERIIPTDAQGELWLKFAPTNPLRTISASRILDGTQDASDIRGRHIFIGATAAGLLDLRASPLDPSIPGVEVHAQALEQMLSGEHLVRPAYATGAELTFLVILGAAVIALMATSGAITAAVVGAIAVAASCAASWFAYARYGLLLDPVYPALSVALLYIATSLPKFIQTEIERAHIRAAFSHYVAPPVVAEIARDYDALKLGGEKRIVTLLFADVRGFSAISENLDAESLVQFINRLFTPIAETILANRGTIDKFMGDAVMAFWNAPLPDEAHVENACRAALRIAEDLMQRNAEHDLLGRSDGEAQRPVRMGIGLNTGECVVGNVGSPERFDYSVLGDAVNMAARFEEATKTFGAGIIAGERTMAGAPNFAWLELGSVTPRGKMRPERIFALAGDENYAASEAFANLRSAHARLRSAEIEPADYASALAECRALAPHVVAAYYSERHDRTSKTPVAVESAKS